MDMLLSLLTESKLWHYSSFIVSRKMMNMQYGINKNWLIASGAYLKSRQHALATTNARRFVYVVVAIKHHNINIYGAFSEQIGNYYTHTVWPNTFIGLSLILQCKCRLNVIYFWIYFLLKYVVTVWYK